MTMYKDLNRLLSFCSVRQALAAEEIIERLGIPGALVPTPRKLDIHCGQCMLFAAEREQQILALFKEKNIRWAKLFIRDSAAETYELYNENTD
jgi:hypothetical protein